MSGQYAKGTEVTVNRSRDELERILKRFGASGFGYMTQGNDVMILFEIANLRVRFRLTMPPRSQFETYTDRWGNTQTRAERTVDKEWEEAQRRLWRSLVAVVKAKLIAVEDGISTVEQEFLAFVVLPDGATVGDRIVPELQEVAQTGNLPALMPGLPERGRVIELGERSS